MHDMAHPITNIGSCGWCVVRADSQQLVLASESLQHWMPVSPQPSSLRKHHLHNHTHEQFNNALSHPSSAIRPDMSSDLKETTELPQITRLSDLFSDSIDMDWECFCISSSKQVLQPSMFRWRLTVNQPSPGSYTNSGTNEQQSSCIDVNVTLMHATDHLLLVLIHNIFECRHCPTHDDTLQQLHHLLSSSQSHVDLAHSQSPPKALHILHASDLSPVFMMPNHYFSKNLGLDLSAVLCGPNLLDQFSGSEESQQFQRALNIQSSGSQTPKEYDSNCPVSFSFSSMLEPTLSRMDSEWGSGGVSSSNEHRTTKAPHKQKQSPNSQISNICKHVHIRSCVLIHHSLVFVVSQSMGSNRYLAVSNPVCDYMDAPYSRHKHVFSHPKSVASINSDPHIQPSYNQPYSKKLHKSPSLSSSTSAQPSVLHQSQNSPSTDKKIASNHTLVPSVIGSYETPSTEQKCTELKFETNPQLMSRPPEMLCPQTAESQTLGSLDAGYHQQCTSITPPFSYNHAGKTINMPPSFSSHPTHPQNHQLHGSGHHPFPHTRPSSLEHFKSPPNFMTQADPYTSNKRNYYYNSLKDDLRPINTNGIDMNDSPQSFDYPSSVHHDMPTRKPRIDADMEHHFSRSSSALSDRAYFSYPQQHVSYKVRRVYNSPLSQFESGGYHKDQSELVQPGIEDKNRHGSLEMSQRTDYKSYPPVSAKSTDYSSTISETTSGFIMREPTPMSPSQTRFQTQQSTMDTNSCIYPSSQPTQQLMNSHPTMSKRPNSMVSFPTDRSHFSSVPAYSYSDHQRSQLSPEKRPILSPQLNTRSKHSHMAHPTNMASSTRRSSLYSTDPYSSNSLPHISQPSPSYLAAHQPQREEYYQNESDSRYFSPHSPRFQVSNQYESRKYHASDDYPQSYHHSITESQSYSHAHMSHPSYVDNRSPLPPRQHYQPPHCEALPYNHFPPSYSHNAAHHIEDQPHDWNMQQRYRHSPPNSHHTHLDEQPIVSSQAYSHRIYPNHTQHPSQKPYSKSQMHPYEYTSQKYEPNPLLLKRQAHCKWTAKSPTSTLRRKRTEFEDRSTLDTPRYKCEACETTHSPEWRRGPHGRKTLCNACGLRYARIISKRKEISATVAAERSGSDTSGVFSTTSVKDIVTITSG
ncbi:hypothetical protein RTP6_000389 [Batrachochytrium dendrobatidis]